jgi:cell division control protein 7
VPCCTVSAQRSITKAPLISDRTIITNVPTVDNTPDSLTPVILKLNPHIYTPPLSNPSKEDAIEHITLIDQAIDLCGRLLRLDATKRITAANALRHPFLAPSDPRPSEWQDMKEDEILDVRAGKCGHLHGVEGNRRGFCFGELVSHGLTSRSRVLWHRAGGHALWPGYPASA